MCGTYDFTRKHDSLFCDFVHLLATRIHVRKEGEGEGKKRGEGREEERGGGGVRDGERENEGRRKEDWLIFQIEINSNDYHRVPDHCASPRYKIQQVTKSTDSRCIARMLG